MVSAGVKCRDYLDRVVWSENELRVSETLSSTKIQYNLRYAMSNCDPPEYGGFFQPLNVEQR